MRALVFDNSPRLRTDAPVPAPAAGEVLLRVLRAGVCSTDLEITRGYMGFRGILGHEFVGRVERCGPNAAGGAGNAALRVGDRVACEINCVCSRCEFCTAGLSNHCNRRSVIGIDGRDGAFAEFIAVPAANCHRIPDNVGDDEAVFVEPLAAAFQITRQMKIEPRHHVTLLGSGRLGLLVAQVIARTGCRFRVIGRNPRTLGLLDRMRIATARPEDVVKFGDQHVVIDCTGSAEGLTLAMRLVRPRGTIVMKSTYADGAPINIAPLVINEVTLLGSRCGPFDEAIRALERRDIDVRPLISRTLPLSRGPDLLAEAAKPDCIKLLIDPFS